MTVGQLKIAAKKPIVLTSSKTTELSASMRNSIPASGAQPPMPGQGYGFQWWTYDYGAYAADGIFGQGIFIDPTRDLVIATNSSWTTAMGYDEHPKREDFFRAVQAAIDAEG